MDTWISCHHNFVRREQPGDEWLYVHRKGAVSARADEPGIVPGSMGAPSYHTCGRGEARGLCSSAHGAGRQLSRGEARRQIRAGDVVAQMDGVWFDHRAADALRDEAPAAYKDIGAVMRAQRELTRVVRRLRPLLNFKGA
ncbi:RtcB family protein [Nannocystis pusilla]|uniref:3'-phosphate/5'-hydroxy nucleic acid ligase n=1 Tax=Nannocystis pusilla TaxID=889268 RepID=A0A9X3EU95_9BACT|nr:RtcB family protein [Nannocystis pusilla]MCY1010156.1 RtcB family protein [Nannocystis pusilla]